MHVNEGIEAHIAAHMLAKLYTPQRYSLEIFVVLRFLVNGDSYLAKKKKKKKAAKREKCSQESYVRE